MIKSTKIAGLVLSAASLAVLAGCNESEAQIAQATQTSSKQPREVCTEETVTEQKPVKDKDRVLGTVAGALVGGVVGNEVGGKGTKGDIATVAGAAAGGYAGNRVQKNVQKNATETTTRTVCRTVYD